MQPKNCEKVLKGALQEEQKMPTICYELANYYVILTNKVLDVHAQLKKKNSILWGINMAFNSQYLKMLNNIS